MNMENQELNKRIFDTLTVGDIIYHCIFGKGVVTSKSKKQVSIKYDNPVIRCNALREMSYFFHHSSIQLLSYTPYNLITGGVTYERPIKLATEEDYDKICKFWSNDINTYNICRLASISNSKYYSHIGDSYRNAKVLTIQEFNEIQS